VTRATLDAWAGERCGRGVSKAATWPPIIPAVAHHVHSTLRRIVALG
jgi:hypothetical protein